jgi:spermidine synthase
MPPLLANVIVFTSSAAVLVLEILAGRLLAPYVGVTLETFTGIIGVVLAGIALGSWYGGRVADRLDPRLLIGPLLLGGGALSLAIVPLVTVFGAALTGTGAIAIVGLALVGFFAPATVLSAVSPAVVKLQLASLDETGQVVGRLSAIGTIGALVGTFTTGFLLLAALPSRPIIVALGGLLVAAGATLWWWLPRGAARPARSPAPLVVLAVVGGALTLVLAGPCDRESAYFCARVVADDARPQGRALVLDTLRHSYVDLSDPTHLEFAYTQIFGDVVDTLAPPRQPISALHIGGAGFTMPRYVDATRPGSDNLVLELDPTLVELAQAELGLELPHPAIDVRIGDARTALGRQPADRYDLVIGDAFGGLAVPWHLTTREFTEQIHTTLRPGGVYVLNVIDYPPLAFARAEAATLRAVFDHVALVAVPARIAGQEGGNMIFVASDHPIPADAITASNRARGRSDVVATGAALDAFIGGARVLVDDFAPVDQLLTPIS